MKTILKQTLLSLTCLIAAGVQIAKAQVNIIALHHEGTVTLCKQGIQDAITQAVEGDTLYLSEGVYGGFTVDKSIAIIGSGMTTSVSYTVEVSGDFDNLYISNMEINKITFSGRQDGMRMVQCRILGNCEFNNDADWDNFSNTEFTMCDIDGSLKLGDDSTNGLIVHNSWIKTVQNGGAYDGAAMFVNCCIQYVSTSSQDYNNQFVNSIFFQISSGLYYNCLYYQSASVPGLSDCWKANKPLFNTDFNSCTLSNEELIGAGYIGTDGNVVGADGGATPFTLVSPILQVTEHNLEVDNTERKLRVSLTLGRK